MSFQFVFDKLSVEIVFCAPKRKRSQKEKNRELFSTITMFCFVFLFKG